MKTFEYCEEHCVFQEHVVIESNKYGRDGWELAAVVPVDKSDRRRVDGRACFDLYFKREVREASRGAAERHVPLDVERLSSACALH